MKRSMPVTESMPMVAMPRPKMRDASPLNTESDTTEEVATNAKSARAKYSAGPNAVESSARVGARKTTMNEETIPPVKAPIAAAALVCQLDK